MFHGVNFEYGIYPGALRKGLSQIFRPNAQQASNSKAPRHHVIGAPYPWMGTPAERA